MSDGRIIIDQSLLRDGPGCCFCGGDTRWSPLPNGIYRVACEKCSSILKDFGVEALKSHLNLVEASIEVDEYL